MQAVLTVVFSLALFGSATVHAGFATSTTGYQAGRYTQFYWLADGEVHRAGVKNGKLVAPENFVEGTEIAIQRAEYDKALARVLRTSLPEDAQATAQIRYYDEQITLHKKALAEEISEAEKERRLAIIASLTAKFPELRKKTIAWTTSAFNANVLSPKVLVLTSESSVETVPENAESYLNSVFKIHEARHAYERYSQHGTVACEYFNSDWTDYDKPGRPTHKIWNMQMWTLLPDLATRQEATDRCKELGLDAAFEMYLFDDHGIHITQDYDGSKTCHSFAESTIGEKLAHFTSTGSPFSDVSRMVWLRIPGQGAYQGPGYPRVGEGGAAARPIALLMSESGDHCHVNGPWQGVGAEWKLNAVCQAETIAGAGWLKPEEIGFPCKLRGSH